MTYLEKSQMKMCSVTVKYNQTLSHPSYLGQINYDCIMPKMSTTVKALNSLQPSSSAIITQKNIKSGSSGKKTEEAKKNKGQDIKEKWNEVSQCWPAMTKETVRSVLHNQFYMILRQDLVSIDLLHSCGITLNPSMAGWRLSQHGKPNRSLDCDNFKTFPVEALKQYSTLFFFKTIY